MYRRLEKEAAAVGLRIEIRSGTAESLPVRDDSIDTVVSTLVLCCVSNQALTLKEVVRILKPGGKFLFIEHVAAPRGAWLRRLQHWVTPLWRQIFDGCHPDRETWLEIERAGFRELHYERFDVPAPIITPHIAGVGVK
jgi:ubiquinone/menaquinone biosynthesis C-methylase UbiE